MTRWWVATRMFSEGNLRSCVSGHRKLPERGQQLQRRGDHAECTGAHRSCAGADLPIPTTEELPADMPITSSCLSSRATPTRSNS